MTRTIFIQTYKKVIIGIVIFLIFALAFPMPAFALTLLGGDPFIDDQRESVSSQIFRDPSPVNGAYTYEFPLTLPPGRNDLAPDVSLVYSSQSSSNISSVGYGWSVNVPSIERVPRYGSDDLYSMGTTSVFYSSLDGEIHASSTDAGTEDFGPLVENGDFRKYEFINNMWWKVTDKDGTTYAFGVTTDARQNDPDVATSTYKWMLEEVRDRSNNYITYDYFKDSGQIYPATTTYTGNDSTDGIYKVEYFLEDRTDIATSTISGFPVVSNYRINEIQVKVDDTWRRKYELAYTTGDNDVRSLLDTITETGQGEDASTLSFPVTDFDYQAQTTTASTTWTQDSNYSVPSAFIASNKDNGVRVFDANGDGLPYVVRAHADETKQVWTNDGDGTGWTEDTNYSIPVSFIDPSEVDMGVRITDINGDGFIDIMQSYQDESTGSTTKKVWTNDGDGTGWTEDTNYSIPVLFILENTGGIPEDRGVRIMDIDGDGLPDLVRREDDTQGVWINKGDGTGWTQDDNYNVPVKFIVSDKDNGVRVADFNGDHLPDLIRGYADETKQIWINNGDSTGWTEDTGYSSFPDSFVATDGDDLGTRMADINADGLIDFIRAWDDGATEVKTVWINDGDGTGWTEDTNYSIPTQFFSEVSNNDYGTRMADVNGDKIPDFVRRKDATEGVWISDNTRADLLSNITTYTGGTIAVNHTTTASTTEDGSSALGNPLLPINLTVTESVVRDDGFGIIGTTTYAYRGGEYYYNNEFNRKFAGFATTTETDPLGNETKTFFHQGNGSQSTIGEYNDDVSKIGKSYRTEAYDDSGNLYKKTITKWENVSLANNRDFVKQTRSVSFTYDGNSDHRDTATEFTYNDGNGNLTQEVNYGEVTGSDDGTFVDSGSDKRTTAIAYALHSGSCYVQGFPKTQTTKDNSDTTVAEKKFYYDSLSHGSVDDGNNTKEERLVEGSTYIDIERTYNSLGLVTQEKDPRDKATTFSYFSDLFVGTTTDPVSLVTEFYRDLSSGEITRRIDPNSREFKTTYDALDRPTKKEIPDHLGTPSSLVTKTDYTYTDTVGSRRILRTDHLSNATSTDSYTYFDGFDRVIQERTEAEDSNTYIVVDTQYDKRDDIAKNSLPYFDTGSSRGSITSDNDLLVSYTYDPLKRVKTVVDTEGTETHAYDQWKEVVTDRAGNLKSFTSDAFGNLVQVDENDGAGTSTASYTYDTLDNLTKITDGLSNIRNFTYDGLSRLTKSEDLHDSADTGFGSTTLSYDDSGNITSKLDAKNQSVSFTYDDINRVLTEDYSGDAGTEIEYGYGWCDEGLGRLCSATTTDAVTNLSYDALGNVTSESREINSTAYTTTYTFDRLGNQTQIVYPDSLTVYYNHNSAGLLETVGTLLAGSTTPTLLIEDIDYGPHGNVTYRKFGNSTESTYTYDATALYRLQQIDTQ